MRNPSTEAKLRWREGIPLIRRDERFAHIGSDPNFLRLSAPEARWLLSIGDSPSWREAQERCPGGVERAEAIVDRARASGAIANAGECWWLTPEHRARVQPHLLSLSQWHPEPESAIAARGTWDVGVLGNGVVADAVRRVIQDSGLRLAADHASSTIVVLVGSHGIDAPEALLAPGGGDNDVLDDRPHLPVSVHLGHAGVGPLVIPGKTPCLRCLHLHRCDADPHWPRIVEQWRNIDQSIDADPLVAWQAAVSATTMIRQWIDSPRTTITHRLQWRLPHTCPAGKPATWHQACGCRWSLVADDVPTAGTSSDTR